MSTNGTPVFVDNRYPTALAPAAGVESAPLYVADWQRSGVYMQFTGDVRLTLKWYDRGGGILSRLQMGAERRFDVAGSIGDLTWLPANLGPYMTYRVDKPTALTGLMRLWGSDSRIDAECRYGYPGALLAGAAAAGLGAGAQQTTALPPYTGPAHLVTDVPVAGTYVTLIARDHLGADIDIIDQWSAGGSNIQRDVWLPAAVNVMRFLNTTAGPQAFRAAIWARAA